MRVLGLIPARSGSKGLIHKNISIVAGKPLIQWTIDTAKKSNVISDIVVSTDCQKYADLSITLGAKVPFLRPISLASDTASSIDVVLHSLDTLEKLNEFYDYIYLLEPTSPLRTAEDIDLSFEILLRSNAESLISIAECKSAHPDFLYLNQNEYLEPYICSQISHARRQDLSKFYYPDGSLYCSSVQSIRRNKSFYPAKTIGYIVKPYQSVEIDDPHDMIISEALLLDRLQNPQNY